MSATICQTATIKTLQHHGCHLAYWQSGYGSPVVLIQGVGVHGCGWSPQIQTLDERHRCLWFDNRGIGKSQPRGPFPLSVEQMAGDALAIMSAEGLESAHIVGHSMGGPIALAMALSGARVKSLALLCTFARGSYATAVSAEMFWIGMRTRLGSRAMRRAAFLEIVLPESRLRSARDKQVLAAEIGEIFGHDLADQPSIVMKQLKALAKYDSTSRLKELSSIPTLVVSATEDKIAKPRFGREIADGIAGSHYVEISDAAHGVTISHANEVNRLLLEHFQRAS